MHDFTQFLPRIQWNNNTYLHTRLDQTQFNMCTLYFDHNNTIISYLVAKRSLDLKELHEKYIPLTKSRPVESHSGVRENYFAWPYLKLIPYVGAEIKTPRE